MDERYRVCERRNVPEAFEHFSPTRHRGFSEARSAVAPRRVLSALLRRIHPAQLRTALALGSGAAEA
jgi:hypothetical protein